MPRNAVSVEDGARGCQAPWLTLSPLVLEAVALGGQISGFQLRSDRAAGDFERRSLPAGHRFFPDCLREQEARLLEWLIRVYQGNCWFFTGTFRDYIHPVKADRLLRRYLARLNQSHSDICGAALLKSFLSVEWQQRDVIHYHLLIFGDRLGSLSRKRWEIRWRMISGGFAADYDAELKAAPYLVKHQVKDNPGGNLHVGGAWRGIDPPRSLRCCGAAPKGFRDVATVFDRAGIATALESSCQDRPA